MSAAEVIEQIKELPANERAQVAKFVLEQDDSWVPESFKEGMKAAQEGRFVDMETALHETPPPHLRTHKIHKLSALYGRTIYAVDIEGDLRSTFYSDGDWIVSVDIGTHEIYKR